MEDNETRAPIFCPTIFSRLSANWNLFAIADRRKPVGGDAERCEKFARRLSSFGAEREIVLVGATLVAVTFDLDPRRRIAFQPFGVGAQIVRASALRS